MNQLVGSVIAHARSDKLSDSAKAGFRIIVDKPPGKDVYTAGDTVTGRVCFSNDEDHDVGEVEVQFLGRSKTKLYRRDGYGNRLIMRGRGNFFNRTKTLYDGQYTHKAPNFEWPFEFVFPEKAEKTTGGTTWKNSHKTFPRTDEYDLVRLPSTMEERGQFLKVMHSFDCFVEYKLQASLKKPGSKKALYEAEAALPFMQVPTDETIATQYSGPSSSKDFEIRSSALEKQSIGRSTSLVEKARSFLGSESLPSTNFRVTMDAPGTLRLGDQATVSLELSHLTQSDTSGSPPLVSLQSVAISIIARTHVRSFKGIKNHENTSDREIPCDIGLQNGNAEWFGPFTKERAYTKQLALDDFYAKGIVPTFTTFNIDRRYKIRATCIFECADKQVKLEKEEDIEILPGLAQNTSLLVPYVRGANSIQGSSIYGESTYGDSMEELPTYESANEDESPESLSQVPSGSEKPSLLD